MNASNNDYWVIWTTQTRKRQRDVIIEIYMHNREAMDAHEGLRARKSTPEQAQHSGLTAPTKSSPSEGARCFSLLLKKFD